MRGLSDMKRKLLLVGLIAGLFIGLTACGNKEDAKDNAVDTNVEVTGEGAQFEPIKKGEQVAEMTVKDYGVIKIRFFSEAAPKAVENFISLSKEGYYDGLTFHRVINDFMIQGGDPSGNGTGGESIWGAPFEDEFSEELFPLRGALCMANSGENTNGSQFFIVQTGDVEESIIKQMEEIGNLDTLIKNYQANGGTPWLWFAHTVFGQVYEGMDVVDKIAQAETNGNDMPAKSIIIETIKIKDYKE